MGQISYTLDDLIIDSLARDSGWTDTIDDGKGNQVPNPTLQADYFSLGQLNYYSLNGLVSAKAKAVQAAIDAATDTFNTSAAQSFPLATAQVVDAGIADNGGLVGLLQDQVKPN